MEEIKNAISRRTFLTGTGAAVSGFVAGSVLGTNAVAMAAPVVAGSYAWPADNTLTLASVKEKAFDAY
ncbi:MAG TPA: hypothetical protein VNU93_09790, partial [Verrucomicrobiae bacterium]|nr:hypothetical protein [Verrucomicrobiae bacterium]